MSVIVGVDGRRGSQAAIQLAAREADFRSEELYAVMAYSSERVLGAAAAQPVATPATPDEQRERVEAVLRSTVRDALGETTANVQMHVEPGTPGRVLVELATVLDAGLMVLATRDDGAVAEITGTVSQYVLRNAPCPVLVVPEARK